MWLPFLCLLLWGETWRDQPTVSHVGCVVIAQVHVCVGLYPKRVPPWSGGRDAGRAQMWGFGPRDKNTLLTPGRVLDLCSGESSCGRLHSNSPFLGDTPAPMRKSGPTLLLAVAFPMVHRPRLRGSHHCLCPSQSVVSRSPSSHCTGMFCVRERGAGLQGSGTRMSSSFRRPGCPSSPRGNSRQASITPLPGG